MEKDKRKKQEWKPLFQLLKGTKVPWGWYVARLIITLALSMATALLPAVSGEIMAGNIFDKGLVILYVISMIGMAILTLPMGIIDSWISTTTDKEFRKTVWKKSLHLPTKELDKIEPSSLISRVTQDTTQISYGLSQCFQMIQSVISFIYILMIVAGMHTGLVKMLMIVVPFMILASIPAIFLHDAQNQTQNALSEYTGFLSERLGSLKQIKAFNAEEKEDVLNDKAAMDFYKAKMKIAKLNLISEPLLYSIEAVVQAVILIYGGYLLDAGEITMQNAVTLFMYSESISMISMGFVLAWKSMKIAQGSAKTVSALCTLPEEKMQREKSFAIPESDIRFEEVDFAYGDGKKVLDKLNLVIPCGQTTAIVGPSGSGKTTVLRLLERLYEPNAGKILYGDTDAEKIHLDEWRESIGMVPQNSPLLFGTIYDNITYGMSEDVSEEMLTEAIKRTNVDQIIKRLPQGIQTDVGDVGERLSGGEKQRIALARMMIRNPDMLLLDEATSNLDAENAYQITESLHDTMKGKTAVIVAHNMQTIKYADHIIFMEHGKVSASGNHEELYGKNESYRRYIELQTGQSGKEALA